MKKSSFYFRRRKLLLFTVCFVLVSCILSLFVGCSSASNDSNNSDSTWRTGFFTTISLSVTSDNGTVTATARNDLTVGFSTVETYVYLYSSEKYPESVAEMKEEKQEFTRDLNIFCSLRAQARTEGESKYWCAKLRYKTNADAWAEVYTSPVLIDGTIH